MRCAENWGHGQKCGGIAGVENGMRFKRGLGRGVVRGRISRRCGRGRGEGVTVFLGSGSCMFVWGRGDCLNSGSGSC